MCWFHGENGIGDRYQGLELKTGEVLRFFEQFTRHKPKIYLGGTEPFIREDLLAILEYLKSQNFSVALATNGTLLDLEKIEKLVDIGVDDIKFSIDGKEEMHDAIRGKGVFKKATQAAKNMAHYKKLKEKPGVLNTTINAI
jgi:MoaA/NifB/PqqE/SkfB family radical SAM enzyme